MTPSRRLFPYVLVFPLLTCLSHVSWGDMSQSIRAVSPSRQEGPCTENMLPLSPSLPTAKFAHSLHLHENTLDFKRTNDNTGQVHFSSTYMKRLFDPPPMATQLVNVSSQRPSGTIDQRYFQNSTHLDGPFPNATFLVNTLDLQRAPATTHNVDSVFHIQTNFSHHHTPHCTLSDFESERYEEENTCPVRDGGNVDLSSTHALAHCNQIGVLHSQDRGILNFKDCIPTVVLIILLHLRKEKSMKYWLKYNFSSPARRSTLDECFKCLQSDLMESKQRNQFIGNNYVKSFVSRFFQKSLKFNNYENVVPLSLCNKYKNVSCVKSISDPINKIPVSKELSRFWRLQFSQYSQPKHVYTVFPATVNSSLTSELGRLATLASLPSSCTAFRIPLAKAGFYYDVNNTNRNPDNQHELVCFSCDVTCSRWDTGESPAEIHRRLSPNCPHVKTLFPDSSGTFSSMSSGIGSSISSSYTSDVASARSSSSLSSVSSTSGSFQETSLPLLLPTGRTSDNHSSLNDLATDCAAIAPTSRPQITIGTYPSNVTAGGRRLEGQRHVGDYLDDRPVLSMDIAVYPQFSTCQSRLTTYRNWPLTHFFDPQTLVTLGFFYAGYADCIRCFYCGVGLKSWEPGDDVTSEHIRWRPHCGFTLATRGRRFVENVLARIQVAEIPGNEDVDTAHERQEPPLHLGNQLMPSTNRSSPARASRTSPTLLNNSNRTSPTLVDNSNRTSPTLLDNSNRTSPTLVDNSNRTSPSYANNTIVSSSHSTGSAASSLLPNILDKMRDMGFPSDLVETALTEVELTEMDVNTLVEKIVELQKRSESDSVHGEHDCRTDMQTDGDTSFLSEEINRIRLLREENARLKARRLCRTCKTSVVGMIFLPCGHVVSCSECGARIRHCTLCNELIRATANVFLS